MIRYRFDVVIILYSIILWKFKNAVRKGYYIGTATHEGTTATAS